MEDGARPSHSPAVLAIDKVDAIKTVAGGHGLAGPVYAAISRMCDRTVTSHGPAVLVIGEKKDRIEIT